MPSRRERTERLRAQRTLIRWEDVLTPRAFLGKADKARRAGDAAMCAALDRSQVLAYLQGQPAPQPFVRSDLGPAAFRYAMPERDRAENLLLVAGTWRGRPGVATVALLQMVDAAAWDVVHVYDPERNHYRSGCPGIARDRRAFAQWARDLGRGYRRTVIIGISQGGAPGLMLGMGWQGSQPRVVAFGPLPPWDMRRIGMHDTPPQAFDPLCPCHAVPIADATVVHSTDEQADVAAAARYAPVVGAATVACGPGVPHNVIGWLWWQGRLAQAIAAILDHAAPVAPTLAALTGAPPGSRAGCPAA